MIAELFLLFGAEKAVDPGLHALKLEVNSLRWKGVPFYIRAGKCLPTNCTEIVGKFRRPPTLIPDSLLVENHLRLRLSPDITIAMGMMNLLPSVEGFALQTSEMVASHSPVADEADAYERVLGAAMAGESTFFAREDYVEQTWSIRRARAEERHVGL